MMLQDLKPIFEHEINIEEISRLDNFLCEILMYYRLKVDTPFKQEDDPVFHIYQFQRPDTVNIKNGIAICFNCDQLELPPNTYQKDITYFINQRLGGVHKVSVYIDNKLKRTIITCDGTADVFNSTFYKTLALVLPRLIPWYLENLSQETKIAIAKLSDSYELESFVHEAIKQEVKNSGIYQEIMTRKMIASYESITNDSTRKMKEKIDVLSEHISQYMNTISSTSAEIRELKNRIKSFEMNSEETKKPFMDLVDFLKSTNENIKIEEIVDSRIYFSMRAEMSEWEDAEYQAYVLNNTHSDSYFFRAAPGGLLKDKLKLLYRSIFDTRKLKVYFGTQIYIDVSNGGLDASKRKKLNYCMDHPHLNNQYFCAGDNTEIIAQYVCQYRLVEAINCVIYMAKQFTIGDSAIGNLFVEDLFKCNCIELPNGEFVDGYGAIDYIERHKEEFEDD